MKVSESIKLAASIHAASGTGAEDVEGSSWIDISDITGPIGVICTAVNLAGAVDAFVLLGNSAADGSGSDVTLATHASPGSADAQGDSLVLEVTAEEIRAADPDVRYISASIDADTAGDDFAVHYLMFHPRYSDDAAFADNIS